MSTIDYIIYHTKLAVVNFAKIDQSASLWHVLLASIFFKYVYNYLGKKIKNIVLNKYRNLN